MISISALGQDSHRFCTPEEWANDPQRCLMLGGVRLEGRPLAGNSDADVLLHALTNALSGLSGKNILGQVADQLCRAGTTDSAAYLALALKDLASAQICLTHISLALEGSEPRLERYIPEIRERIAELCGLAPGQVGLTATSGEGLTSFGRGEGLSAFCIVSATKPQR